MERHRQLIEGTSDTVSTSIASRIVVLDVGSAVAAGTADVRGDPAVVEAYLVAV